MFDLGGWSEFLVIVIAALIIIGPKDLPKVLYHCGKFVGKIQRLTAEFKKMIDAQVQAVEIEEFTKAQNAEFADDIEETLKKTRQEQADTPKPKTKTSKKETSDDDSFS